MFTVLRPGLCLISPTCLHTCHHLFSLALPKATIDGRDQGLPHGRGHVLTVAGHVEAGVLVHDQLGKQGGVLLHPMLHVHLVLLVAREGSHHLDPSILPFLFEKEVCFLVSAAKEQNPPLIHGGGKGERPKGSNPRAWPHHQDRSWFLGECEGTSPHPHWHKRPRLHGGQPVGAEAKSWRFQRRPVAHYRHQKF